MHILAHATWGDVAGTVIFGFLAMVILGLFGAFTSLGIQDKETAVMQIIWFGLMLITLAATLILVIGMVFFGLPSVIQP